MPCCRPAVSHIMYASSRMRSCTSCVIFLMSSFIGAPPGRPSSLAGLMPGAAPDEATATQNVSDRESRATSPCPPPAPRDGRAGTFGAILSRSDPPMQRVFVWPAPGYSPRSPDARPCRRLGLKAERGGRGRAARTSSSRFALSANRVGSRGHAATATQPWSRAMVASVVSPPRLRQERASSASPPLVMSGMAPVSRLYRSVRKCTVPASSTHAVQ